jgi:hypothetical protein
MEFLLEILGMMSDEKIMIEHSMLHEYYRQDIRNPIIPSPSQNQIFLLLAREVATRKEVHIYYIL